MVGWLPGGAVVLGVADGVGSAPLAALGARTAVAAVVAALGRAAHGRPPRTTAAWEKCLRAALTAGHRALVRAARGARRPVADLATTAVVAVLGRGGAAAAQVGNGAVVADLGHGPASLTVCRADGRYADGSRSLTDGDHLDHAQVVVRTGPVAGLAVITDGLEDLCLVRRPRASEVPHAGFFRPLFEFARAGSGKDRNRALAAFLDSDIVRRRSDDDRTLIIAAVKDIDDWAAEILMNAPEAGRTSRQGAGGKR
jgi:hypothetical protein